MTLLASLCLGLVLGLLAGGYFASASYRAVLDRERSQAATQLAVWEKGTLQLLDRNDQLGRMLDERRAYDLKVTPPPLPDALRSPADIPLDSAFTKELAGVEDEEARQEFEALIRSAVAADPARPAQDIIREVFSG